MGRTSLCRLLSREANGKSLSHLYNELLRGFKYCSISPIHMSRLTHKEIDVSASKLVRSDRRANNSLWNPFCYCARPDLVVLSGRYLPISPGSTASCCDNAPIHCGWC